MPTPVADVGTGTRIAFGTSSFAALLMSVNPPERTVPIVDISHLGTTGARVKMSGDLVDNGDVTMNIMFDPNERPTLGGTTESVTLTFPPRTGQSTGATWVFPGIVSKFTSEVPLDDKMTGSVTIAVCGGITFTNAS